MSGTPPGSTREIGPGEGQIIPSPEVVESAKANAEAKANEAHEVAMAKRSIG